MTSYEIVNLRRVEAQPRPYFAAELIVREGNGDETHRVDTRLGSWSVELKGGARRHLLPHVAAELQASVKTLERREARST